MKKYTHTYELTFSLTSDNPSGADVTTAMLIVALLRRVADLVENDELHEAISEDIRG